MAVTGWTVYRELLAHQVEGYLPVWETFLLRARPVRLLEIGTVDGGFILSHDYAITREHFDAKLNGRLWNWCELTEWDLYEVSMACHLEARMTEAFQSIMWVCKQRVNPPGAREGSIS